MKKLLALICIALVTISCKAHAYDKEIRFRGIPWLTFYKDCLNINFNTDYGFNDPKDRGMDGNIWSLTTYYHGTVSSVLPEADYSDFSNTGATFELSAILNKDLNVAGYPVDKLSFSFIEPGTDIVKKQTSDQAQFYAAEYTFDSSTDADVLMPIMLEKLTTLYGDPTVFNPFPNDARYTLPGYIWQGANDTCVILYADRYTFTGNDTTTRDVHIRFAYELAPAIAEQEQAIREFVIKYDGLF